LYILRVFKITVPQIIRQFLQFAWDTRYEFWSRKTWNMVYETFWIIGCLIFIRKVALKLTKYCICKHINLSEIGERNEFLYESGLKHPINGSIVFYSYNEIINYLKHKNFNTDFTIRIKEPLISKSQKDLDFTTKSIISYKEYIEGQKIKKFKKQNFENTDELFINNIFNNFIFCKLASDLLAEILGNFQLLSKFSQFSVSSVQSLVFLAFLRYIKKLKLIEHIKILEEMPEFMQMLQNNQNLSKRLEILKRNLEINTHRILDKNIDRLKYQNFDSVSKFMLNQYISYQD